MFTTTTPAETEALGEQLGKHLQSGDVVCLSGELGAGKTALTRGMARGWGAREPVTSPTFTLVNIYSRDRDAQRFFHLDCYRLAGAEEARTVALDDILDEEGVLVVEWPERISEALPETRLWIALSPTSDDQHRMLTLQAHGERAEALIKLLE